MAAFPHKNKIRQISGNSLANQGKSLSRASTISLSIAQYALRVPVKAWGNQQAFVFLESFVHSSFAPNLARAGRSVQRSHSPAFREALPVKCFDNGNDAVPPPRLSTKCRPKLHSMPRRAWRTEWDNHEHYDVEELLRSCDGAEGANTNFDTTFNKSTGPSTKTSKPITDALTLEPIFDLDRLTTDERNAVLCCLARLNTSDRCHGASIDAASALVAIWPKVEQAARTRASFHESGVGASSS